MLGDLYTLRLQDTPAWPSFDGDPDNFPTPARVAEYLTTNGILLGDNPPSVWASGDVMVWALNNPEIAWTHFTNEPGKAETQYETDIATVQELGPSADNRLLAAISRLLLKALNAEP